VTSPAAAARSARASKRRATRVVAPVVLMLAKPFHFVAGHFFWAAIFLRAAGRSPGLCSWVKERGGPFARVGFRLYDVAAELQERP